MKTYVVGTFSLQKATGYSGTTQLYLISDPRAIYFIQQNFKTLLEKWKPVKILKRLQFLKFRLDPSFFELLMMSSKLVFIPQRRQNFPASHLNEAEARINQKTKISSRAWKAAGVNPMIFERL